MIGKTISHYKILEKLGEGGMGVVYKAEDIKLDRIVALKFLPPELTSDEEAKQRLLHEAQAASSLSHQNICSIHTIEEFEDRQIIDMEFVEGKTLSAWLKEKEFSLNEVIAIAVQIAEGLNAAHKKGIVHRDIKPDNIMLTEEGMVKIMDFGLAKAKGSPKLTKTHSTLGTLSYMSPEQAQGEKVDQRSDIFSFGAVLYEMITHQRPFKGEHEAAIMYSLLNEAPEPLTRYKSNVSAELQRIVDKSLAKNKDERYQHMDDALADLKLLKRTWESGEGVVLSRVMKPGHKRPWLLYAGIFLVVILLVAVVAYFIHTEQAPLDSIAVLPFQNLSAESPYSYFAGGLHDELLTQLSKVAALTVISRTSVMGYVGTTKSIKQIASELGVRSIVEGSVQVAAERLRVNVQLIDAKTDTHIWAERYDSTLDDAFAIESDIAQQIVAAIGMVLSPLEQQGLNKAPTDNAEAYRYYLQGKDFLNKGSWKDAWDSYSKAVASDSTFAVAYLDMWRFANQAGHTQEVTDLVLDKAMQYANNVSEKERLLILTQNAYRTGRLRDFRQLNMDLLKKYPNCYEAYKNLGDYYFYRRDYDISLKFWKKAEEFEQNSIEVLDMIGFCYEKRGEKDSARHYVQKIVALFPNDGASALFEGYQYLKEGEIESAFQSARRSIALNPKEPWGYQLLGIVHIFANHPDSAETVFQQVGVLDWPGNTIINTTSLYFYQGKYDDVFRFLHKSKQVQLISVRYQVKTCEFWFYIFQNQKDKAKELWNSDEDDLYTFWLSQHRRGSDAFIADSLLNFAIPKAYCESNITEALKLCDRVSDEIKQNDLGGDKTYWELTWRSMILYSENRFSEAASIFKSLILRDPITMYRYYLADCFYQQKKYKEAKSELLNLKKYFEPMYYFFEKMSYFYFYPRTLYLLGVVNEALGNSKEAMKAYQNFLYIWKEADSDIPELIDAKMRLAKLTTTK